MLGEISSRAAAPAKTADFRDLSEDPHVVEAIHFIPTVKQ
jgi:hypothetical protein